MDNVYIVVRDIKDKYLISNKRICHISAHKDKSAAQEKCDAINNYEQNFINPILTLPEEQIEQWEKLEESFSWAADEYYDPDKDYKKEEANMYINHGFDSELVHQYMEWKQINENGLGPAYCIEVPYE